MTLRSRLPRVDGRTLRLANHFYGARAACRIEAWNRTLTWRWTYRDAPIRAAEVVRVAAGPGSGWIAIEHDRGFCPDPSLDWGGRTGDARLLAWTLSYEPLIAHLRQELGILLEPSEIARPGESHGRTPDAPLCVLAFDVCDEEGEALLAGAIGVNADQVALRDGAQRDRGVADGVPIAFRISLGSIRVPMAAFQSLEHGDVVVLGSASRIGEGGRLRLESEQTRLALTIVLGSGGGRVESFDTAYTRNGRTSMQSDPAPAAKEGGANPIDLDSFPVVMSFDAGEIGLTIGELRALGRGSVLSLGRELADSPVTVRVNGLKFATAELVLVDDMLGVRILELHGRGSD